MSKLKHTHCILGTHKNVPKVFVSLVESSQMTIYISCMLQISSHKKRAWGREKKRGATLITCEILCRCLRDPLITFLRHHHDNVAIKHSDISEYSIWYSRVIQYYPPGIQQMIYPSKLAHAENTIDSHTHYLQTLPTYYSNIVLNFAFQYICQRLGFFFFFPLQTKCCNQNINSLSNIHMNILKMCHP